MIGVFIVPTGIGAEIGGHAGDATPAAKLIAACCDTLITHPNVLNASDINEMSENMLYVEGSILDRFLEGTLHLQSVRDNKILVAVNKPATPESINAVSAARATLGVEINIVELNCELELVATMKGGKASGTVFGVGDLIDQVRNKSFDALAIHTEIKVPKDIALNYFRNGGINPWGGVEAIASKMIADGINKPVAHAPLESENTKNDSELFFIGSNEIVDPRMAAEVISNCYLHSVLKGLSKAPRIGTGRNALNYKDIDFMLSPHGCNGRPHAACYKNNIPIIIVKENKTIYESNNCIGTYVDNYVEAAGVIMAMKAGIDTAAVKRPLPKTDIL